MTAIFTLFLAFIGGVTLTHFYIQAADGRGPVALPNHRTMHKGRVVVGGGIPLLVSALITTLIFWPLDPRLGALIATGLVLAVVSFLDDMQPISRRLRFAVHLGAAVACVVSVHYSASIFGDILPFWLDRLLAVLALVWYINLYNFMDGIDGIASVETATVAGGYAIVVMSLGDWNSVYLGLALAVAGAALGFLFWNWHPARIFLGDVGSIPLGLITGWLMVDLAVRVSLAAALILPLYFAADASLTILNRLRKGERIWEPHRSHFYQRSARAAGSHSVVVKCVIAANCVLVGLAVLALTKPFVAFALAVLTVAVLLSWMQFLATRPIPQQSDEKA
ncbi:putative Glycosyl transferase WbpL [Candidatus Filomicrobium marinum]|uniref:Putative Glycosyl transferase WbpL n=1 Tax=Candidatus Filomicrobium marinum TaxID=1608628 RepID=A0A0D6JFM3_9HYPH|nr:MULTISPECIES: glycosyltransferase family 4 protein [Filomicrobium]MCV0370112.1 glycosyltransferase family 4 protein [Filomicrobium sp.]CFX26109.1 putative Glycosyl transferase WbpL [Candidatus Filomicrobium marinum]CPR19391.1 putative Glycosyl transferase WbpL [Candidatus Filomicrobium marinum]